MVKECWWMGEGWFEVICGRSEMCRGEGGRVERGWRYGGGRE